MKEQEPIDLLRNIAGMSVGLSVIMIILGCLAIAMPNVTGLAVSAVFGWLLVVAGFIYLAYAFAAGGVGGFIWRTLIGLAYIVGGSYLVLNTGLTLEALTFAVAVVFVMEGIFQIIAYFQVREESGAGWILFDGIVSAGLGVLIGYNWPSSSGWAIGTLVGANLIVSGFTRLMYSSMVKRAIGGAPAH